MVLGNRLVIQSDDPEALQLVNELYRLITQPHTGDGDFEVIKLQNANATDLAKTLDELYNGKQQPQQSPFSFFPGRPRSRGAQQPASTTTKTEVRVVAAPATNSILVRANNPVVMLSIRDLIEHHLDVHEKDATGLVKTRIIGPLQYTTATEVANV